MQSLAVLHTSTALPLRRCLHHTSCPSPCMSTSRGGLPSRPRILHEMPAMRMPAMCACACPSWRWLSAPHCALIMCQQQLVDVEMAGGCIDSEKQRSPVLHGRFFTIFFESTSKILDMLRSGSSRTDARMLRTGAWEARATGFANGPALSILRTPHSAHCLVAGGCRSIVCRFFLFCRSSIMKWTALA